MLRSRGLKVFFDRDYLTPGQAWPALLEKHLRACRAVAICLGPEGLGPWQQREQYVALDRQAQQRDFPVIPLLLTRRKGSAAGLPEAEYVGRSQGGCRGLACSEPSGESNQGRSSVARRHWAA